MTRRMFAAVLALCLLLVSPAAAPARQADPQVTNDEVVLVTVDPSGLPQNAQLISRITAAGGPQRTIVDPSSTTNLSYRDRPGSPPTTPQGVLVEVGGGPTTVLTQALFDRPLPVALHARYALDSRVVDPADIPGAVGDITITYTATNTTAQLQTIGYTDAAGVARSADLPVFAPFAGSLVVTVPRGMSVLEAPGASSATDASGATVLRFDLLLAPPGGDFTKQVVAKLRASSPAATPAAVMAVAPATGAQNTALGFAAGLLEESAAASVELAAGIRALDDASGLLAEGSAALAAGAAELAAGQRELSGALGAGAQGAQAAVDGSDALAAGLAALTEGLRQLSGAQGLPAAASAAGQLAGAAALLSGILGSSSDGPWRPQIVWPEQGWPPGLPSWPPTSESLPQWAQAIEALPVVLRGLEFLPDGRPRDQVCYLDADDDGLLDDPVTDSDCVPTLVQSLRMLAAAAGAAGEVAGEVPGLLEAAAADLASARGAASGAAQQAEDASAGAAALAADLCGTPALLAPQHCEALRAIREQARTAAQSAGSAVQGIDAAAPDLAGAAVRSGGLAVGLPLLAVLLQGTARIAEQAGDGLQAGLLDGLEALQEALVAAAAAAGQLAGAAAQGQDGAARLAAGTAVLAQGLDTAVAGADALGSGADALGWGAGDLALGVDQLRRDGIAPALQAIIDGSADAALAAAYQSAVDARAADALPYGAPQGATGNVAYVLQMPATQAGGSRWPALAILAGLMAAGFAGALLRRGKP